MLFYFILAILSSLVPLSFSAVTTCYTGIYSGSSLSTSSCATTKTFGGGNTYTYCAYMIGTNSGTTYTIYGCAASCTAAGSTVTYNSVTYTVSSMALCTTESCNGVSVDSSVYTTTCGSGVTYCLIGSSGYTGYSCTSSYTFGGGTTYNYCAYATVSYNYGYSISGSYNIYGCAANCSANSVSYGSTSYTVTKMQICATNNCNTGSSATYQSTCNDANAFHAKGRDLFQILIVALTLIFFS